MSGNLNCIRVALISLLCLIVSSVTAQTITQTVRGTVKDNTGETVIGATVIEDGMPSNGTVTDMDGNFTLYLKGNSKRIKVSYIGMKSQTLSVAGKNTVDVTLQDEAHSLNDVVVIGYGTVKKKDLTGSVSSIDADDIANVPVSNVGEAMTGKMAGVSITTTEGSPDADVTIRVRGGGSLSQDNSPLYIVDGFEVSSISDIAPSEIESIDVLKDASSTAIYGSRGANGVIIITTKSGKKGKVQVSLNASVGFKKLAKEIKTLDPYNYALYQYELESTDYGNYHDLDIYKSIEGTNYQNEIFGRTGVQQQYNLGVSGGTDLVKYNFGYANNTEKSIMLGSGYQKHNLNGKFNIKVSKWVSIDLNARYAYTKIKGLSGGAETNQSNAANSIVANAVRWRPVEPLTSSDDDETNSTTYQKNPLERINATYRSISRRRQDYNFGLNWKPFKGITARTEAGYSISRQNNDEAWAADAVTNSKYGYNGAPQARLSYDNRDKWRNANTVTYDNKKLFGGRDHINVMVGQEWSKETRTTYNRTYVNFPANYTTSQTLNSINENYRYDVYPEANYREVEPDTRNSYFGRINYTLNEKYLATVTFRADGSSKFAKGHKWGYFPAAALAWRVSDEAFLKDSKWLSNLKLRLSYGEAGNDRIDPGYKWLVNQYTASSDRHAAFTDPTTNVESMTTAIQHKEYLYNENLTWETTVTRNIGLDYGFWDNRINGTLDFYWNSTKDLLMKSAIATSSGYQYQYQNFGETSNKGVEFALNAAIVQNKFWDLNFNFNIGWNKNKIEELNNSNPWQSSKFAGSVISKYDDFLVTASTALGELWGYKTNGFYTVYDPATGTGDLVLQSNGTWKLAEGHTADKSYSSTGGTLYPGGLKLEVDENGDPIKQKLGNTIAPIRGGFGLSANWNHFDFNVFFNYSIGNKILNGTKLANSFYQGSARNYNLVNDFNIDNRYTWIDPSNGFNLGKSVSADIIAYYGGTEGVMARLNELNANANIWNPAAISNMPIIDWAVEDASFLRLQNITVGYTLPAKWFRKLHISSFRIYATAYNLLCISGYDGYDPEVDTSSKNNPMTPGIDYAAYPKARTFVGGVNITF